MKKSKKWIVFYTGYKPPGGNVSGKATIIADDDAQARRIFKNLHPQMNIYRVNRKEE